MRPAAKCGEIADAVGDIHGVVVENDGVHERSYSATNKPHPRDLIQDG